MENSVSFFSRLAMAMKLIFSAKYANTLVNGNVEQESKTEAVEAPTENVKFEQKSDESALQLLALLQKEGRLLDFINQDVNQFPDEDVAAAARVVHQGVKTTLSEHVKFEPVADGEEGQTLALEADYDRNSYRLTGNISASENPQGTLIHKGWKVTELTLPKVSEGTDLTIAAPAEVEV